MQAYNINIYKCYKCLYIYIYIYIYIYMYIFNFFNGDPNLQAGAGF